MDGQYATSQDMIPEGIRMMNRYDMILAPRTLPVFGGHCQIRSFLLQCKQPVIKEEKSILAHFRFYKFARLFIISSLGTDRRWTGNNSAQQCCNPLLQSKFEHKQHLETGRTRRICREKPARKFTDTAITDNSRAASDTVLGRTTSKLFAHNVR